MRNYKAKMELYRLPKERYRELREFCQMPEAKEYIIDALTQTFNQAPDTLSWWIYQHVSTSVYNWAYMEARQIPCSRDTFRIYRAKFYFCLNEVMKKRGEKK